MKISGTFKYIFGSLIIVIVISFIGMLSEYASRFFLLMLGCIFLLLPVSSVYFFQKSKIISQKTSWLKILSYILAIITAIIIVGGIYVYSITKPIAPFNQVITR